MRAKHIVLLGSVVLIGGAIAASNRSRAEPDAIPASLAASQTGNDIPLHLVTAFRCTFPQDVSGDFDGRSFSRRNGSGFRNQVLVFTSIDTAAATAQMVGNAGTADLRIVTGMGSMTFLERSPSGNPILTTIFTGHRANQIETKNYPKYTLPTNYYVAVMSRHIGDMIGGPPVISQNYGTCQAVS